MRNSLFIFSCLPFAGALTLSASLLENDAPGGIHLAGPEVTKLDWNTRALTASDVDRDGLQDIVLINNDNARIEVLFQKGDREDEDESRRVLRQNRWEPTLEDSRFIKVNVSTGVSMYDVAVGDFNSDGLSDFVYTSKSEGLTFLFQDEGEVWTEKKQFDEFEVLPWASTLKIEDLNGDDLDDVAVLGSGRLLLYFQDKKEGMVESQSLWLSRESFYALETRDINGDGLIDLQYQSSNNERGLRVRMQYASGGFGPELSYPLEVASGTVQALTIKNAEQQAYAFIQSKTRTIDVFQLDPVENNGSALEELFPQVYATGNHTSAKTSYAVSDFNQDGYVDLMVADAEDARVWYYQQNKQGVWRTGIDYPSLTGVSSMKAMPSEKKKQAPRLLLLSDEEDILGMAQFNDEQRLRFPKSIAVEGKPESFTVGDIDADGVPELLVVESRKRDFYFSVLKKAEEGKGYEVSQSIEIDGLKRAPRDVRLFDFDQDGKQEVMLVLPREPVRIFRIEATEEGLDFVETAEDSGMRKSLLDDLQLAQIGFGDVDGDGKDEFLVGGKGFIRVLVLNEEGELEVIEQFNSRRGDDAVRIPMILDFDNDGEKEVVLYATEQRALQVLEQDEQGVFRYTRSYLVGEIDPIHCEPIYRDIRTKRGGKKSKTHSKEVLSHLLVLGKEKFWMLPLKAEGLVVHALSSYETDLQDVSYNQVHVGDFNSDGTDEMLLLDGKNHVMEILKMDAETSTWKSALHFTIFDENLHYGGRKGAPLEPREVLVGDFTGDGKEDFALLVHDRILLYPQVD